MEALMRVKDLRVYYDSTRGDYKAVDGATFSVRPGEVFGIAGESGCGKSTLVEGVLRLVFPPGYIPEGSVLFEDNVDVLALSPRDLTRFRWTKMAYVPQGSMNSLNPVVKIEEQTIDVIRDHLSISRREARQRVIDALAHVALPKTVLEMYPHQLSGGMKQRTLIAVATLLSPPLLIADEPTTALDVVIQKGILLLLRHLKEAFGMTVVMVSHDIAAHAQIADRMGIMYAGKIVEVAPVSVIFAEPLHPYTKMLIAAAPSVGGGHVQEAAHFETANTVSTCGKRDEKNTIAIFYVLHFGLTEGTWRKESRYSSTL